MKKLLITLLLIPFLSFAQTEKLPFQDLDVFQLEYAGDPQISPDGDMIVYVRYSFSIMNDRKTGNLWIMKSDGSEHRKLTSDDRSESSPRWSPDGKRIAFVSGSDQGSELYVYWLKSGKIARLSQLDNSPSGISWSPDGQQIAFSMHVSEKEPTLVSGPKKPKGAQWAESPQVITRVKHEADGSGFMESGFRHFFVIPADGGTARQITSGDYHHSGTPQWTRNSQNLVFSANRSDNWEYEFVESNIFQVNIANGSIKQLTDRQGPDYSPVISPDGSKIAYVGYDDKVQTYQLTQLYVMNADGSNKKLISENQDISIGSPKWDSKGRGLYFSYDYQGDTKIGYLDLNGKFTEIADGMGGTTIGRPYGGGSYSKSKQDQMVYTHCTAYRPSDVALLQSNKNVKLLTDLNSDLLDYRKLGKVEEVWYPSSFDGRDIQGWVVFPPDFEESQKYPLLVENHGGPISNYGNRFSPEMQLYAAAGYVVFYPNPRGSTGYGEEFANLLHHNYPSEDYNDVMDGVDVLIDKGYIDEEKLYVTGGSAGGIMTAWIIGKTNRFKASAVVKPVMNWYSKVLVADNYYYYHNYRYPGNPWTNMEDYMKFSPISLVGNVETPTLVMVGTEDLRTPLSEAKQLYHALKLRKIETALVKIPGASHNIARRPSQMITKVAHILAWFEKFP